jgi:uncharacterized membrane protein YdbT with pleckstrin-like domain
MNEETKIWTGNPSQILNLPVFLICALAAGALVVAGLLFNLLPPPMGLVLAGLAIVPIAIALWRWIATRCERYELTSERLLLTKGVFSRKTETLELYRVKDYALVEPFWMRVFNLGDVVLTTTDDNNQRVLLRAVHGAKPLSDDIRKNVEVCRDRKRVRVSEFE